MRVVLDSNVIIAAFAARGFCQALFEYCLESHEVFVCEGILKEITAKLVHKIGVPTTLAAGVESYLRVSVEVVRPARVPPETCRDKRDLIVLGTAVASGAEYIITGDMDLLSLRQYKNIKAVSPRTFWQIARGKRSK